MRPTEAGEFKVDMDAMKRKRKEDRVKILKHRARLIWGEFWGACIPMAFIAIGLIIYHVDPVGLEDRQEDRIAATFVIVAFISILLLSVFGIWDCFVRDAMKRIKRNWNP